MTEKQAFANWLAGFIDGEGCFILKANNTVRPSFCFKIRLRQDDEPILHEIRSFVGHGNIYQEPSTVPGKCPVSSFVVSSIAGCVEVCRILEGAPLRAKKKADFQVWKRAIHEIQSTPRCRGRDSELLSRLADELTETRLFR